MVTIEEGQSSFNHYQGLQCSWLNSQLIRQVAVAGPLHCGWAAAGG